MMQVGKRATSVGPLLALVGVVGALAIPRALAARHQAPTSEPAIAAALGPVAPEPARADEPVIADEPVAAPSSEAPVAPAGPPVRHLTTWRSKTASAQARLEEALVA